MAQKNKAVIMKKAIVIGIVVSTGILYAAFINSQKTASEKLETVQRDGKSYVIRRQFYSNGRLKTELPYLNNELNGVTRSYYRNGDLESEANMVDGRQKGEYKRYYKSGKLWHLDRLEYESKETFKQKTYKMQGSYYDNNGTLQMEYAAEWLKKKQISGYTKFYKKSGELEIAGDDSKPSIKLIGAYIKFFITELYQSFINR